ncbi:breast cancer metastasis-suppressor 1-like protein isoform X1 [Rhodnius prolixus]|uniref:breast cancer metastasis-suppressor 1-like protein isoform X1 n=1 Tax=Rhodnius prolixus TaxID=13249 RepID=UPI003D18D33E
MRNNMKDDRDDTDGEEMDHDSGESSSTTTDSSDGSDSDDSSEMDQAECERRRNECLDILADLERQFMTLREQLYRERIAQIKAKLEEVHEGIAKEYRMPVEELQDNMRIRIEVAGILRKLRMENIENNFKAEEQAAKQNYENEKILLFDSMKEELEEKIRRLEEDRNSADFQNDILACDRGRGGKSGRGIWRRGSKGSEASRRKPVTVTGPYIVYMLSDSEILEDWTAIKKAMSSSKRESRRHLKS